MSDSENTAYNSPETQIVPEQIQVVGNLTEPMHRYLREASPWLRFIGIVGFVSSGGMALLGLVSLMFSGTLSSIMPQELTNVPFWLGSLFYVATGVVLFFPAYYAYKSGVMIRKYMYSSTDADLEDALRNNKALWKFYGIITIVSLCLIPVIIIVSVIIGIAVSGLF